VPRAQLARVLAVVGEVLGRQQAVLVADQPVGVHAPRVELHLQLYVLADGEQGAAHLLHQHLARLQQPVDVRVVAVAVAVVGARD
jgi:hypothetical protein